jgi:hypothetical protein
MVADGALNLSTGAPKMAKTIVPTPQPPLEIGGEVYFTTLETSIFLRVSLRQLDVWKRSGYMPQPFHLGHRCMWRKAVLEEWVANGCKPMPRLGRPRLPRFGTPKSASRAAR